MAYGAEIAVVALIAAAVAASATTAIKVANNDPRVADYDDAFAEWLGSFLPSLAVGAAAGGVGAAVQGAGEVASAGVDAGMYAGVSEAEVGNMYVQAGSQIGTGAAQTAAEVGSAAAQLGAGAEIGGLSAAEAGQALSTTAMEQAATKPLEAAAQTSSWYDDIGGLFNNLSPTKYLSNWAGVSDQAYEATDTARLATDTFMSWKGDAEARQTANREKIDKWSGQVARFQGTFGGTRQFAQRGKMEGLNYQIASETDPFKATTSLGNKQDSFSYYDNVYA